MIRQGKNKSISVETILERMIPKKYFILRPDRKNADFCL